MLQASSLHQRVGGGGGGSQQPACGSLRAAAAAQPRPRAASRCSSRRQLVVAATLVGPDPRLASSVGNSNSSSSSSRNGASSAVVDLSRPPKGLRGREVEEAAMWRCIQLQQAHPGGLDVQLPSSWRSGGLLEGAYGRCAEVTSEYAKTFYLGTQLMTQQQARAIWAIYVWCRRTDELVDGPNASRITPKALDRWEERLEAAFEGRPYDELDATLTDTLSQFPVDIQPFRDMIDGMRMDLVKSRYDTYDELYEYCYRVAGTVALMSMPVMGVDKAYKGPLEPVYRAALALGTANQLTNILRDVGEDLETRNRIYVPLEDLRQFGIKETELLGGGRALLRPDGTVDERWQKFMAFQIARARKCFEDAEAGVDLLDQNARWPVWSALILYRQILDAIEANGYNNFTRRAYVPKWRKLASLPLALGKARFPQLNPGYRAAIAAGAINVR